MLCRSPKKWAGFRRDLAPDGRGVAQLADDWLDGSRLRMSEVFHGGPDIPGKWSAGMSEVTSCRVSVTSGVSELSSLIMDVTHLRAHRVPGEVLLRNGCVTGYFFCPLRRSIGTQPFTDGVSSDH